MKKAITILLIVAMILAFSSVAFAAQDYDGQANNNFFSTSKIYYWHPAFGRDLNYTVCYSGANYSDYTSRIYRMPSADAPNSQLTPAMNTIFNMTTGDYQWGYIEFFSPVNYYKFKASNSHSGYTMRITGSYDVWSNPSDSE